MKSQHRKFLPIPLMILFVAGCAAESDFDEYCSPSTVDYTGSLEADMVGRYWKHCPPTNWDQGDVEPIEVCYLRADGHLDRWGFRGGELTGVSIGDRRPYQPDVYHVDARSITLEGSRYVYLHTEGGAVHVSDGVEHRFEPLACAGLPDSVE